MGSMQRQVLISEALAFSRSQYPSSHKLCDTAFTTACLPTVLVATDRHVTALFTSYMGCMVPHGRKATHHCGVWLADVGEARKQGGGLVGS